MSIESRPDFNFGIFSQFKQRQLAIILKLYCDDEATLKKRKRIDMINMFLFILSAIYVII